VQLVGMFMNLAEGDLDMADRRAVFKEGLTGYTEGQNVRLEYRYGAGDFPRYRKLAKELVALRNEQGNPPDVIFSGCGPSWRALEAEMASAKVNIPIVFAGMIDPTPGAALDPRSSHIVTGFISYRADLCEKWPPLLKRMVPQLTKAAILYDPGDPLSPADSRRQLGKTQLDAIRKAAAGLDASAVIDVTASKREIENDIADFARTSAGKGGLIVPGATLAATCRDFITGLAIEYKLPAIYANRMYTKSGGLMAYGAKTLNLYKNGAGLVAKILKKQTVDGPTHLKDFELVINQKTANEMGHTVPPDLLREADYVIR
jgi:putative ABC transport system substrate-binding protein